MRKSWILSGLATVVAAGTLSVATAQMPAHGMGGGEDTPLHRFISGQIGRVMTMRADVNLSAQQKDKIRQIVTSHRQEIINAVQPLIKNGRALRDATIADTADENAIRAAAADVGKSLGDAAVLGAKIKAEVHQVLTPEQIQTVQDFRKATDKAVDELMHEVSSAK